MHIERSASVPSRTINIVTSDRVVQDWGRYLGEATIATTILDRLMLEFEPRSYRLKEAAARIAVTADAS